jgi:S-adenosylmethionine:tRNA ribosyltransferase-isomerase
MSEASPTDLLASDLDYPLDPALVALRPVEPRDSARLMVVHRREDRVEHRRVRDLPEYLDRGDLMVVNRTRVEPRRLVIRRRGGGRGEALLLEPLGEGRWRCLLKPSRRIRPGDHLEIATPSGETAGSLEVLQRQEEAWLVRWADRPIADAAAGVPSDGGGLDRGGWTPLPPYILKGRREAGIDPAAEESADRIRYQTVYAEGGWRPSVAAPTAGLHFTPELLARIAARQVEIGRVELSVGAGTFRPVESPRLAEHPMEAEWCRIEPAELARLAAQDRRRAGGEGRTLAIGTTSVRTLESLPVELPTCREPLEFITRLMIAPGFEFRRTDLLLTNFHLPRSTLLALVGAMTGLERLKSLYALAAAEGYRFYSFGDAMLLLP